MQLSFIYTQHAYEPGSIFEDAICHGVYIEVGDTAAIAWFQKQGLQGNGYTVLALIAALCRTELADDHEKYAMEAEADNAWVYGRDQAAIERLVNHFKATTATVAGIEKLIAAANPEFLE